MRFPRRTKLVGLSAALLLALASPGRAHKPSDSYLALSTADGGAVEGQWDIALRDLEVALGLDADQDGAVTWGELRARHRAIAGYALARLTVRSDGAMCRLEAGEQLVDHHSDGAYSVLRFTALCPRSGTLSVGYRLFFDLDPSHRGLLRFDAPGAVRTAVLSPDAPRVELAPHRLTTWREITGYWREGVWHIWIGFDHILFLLTLLVGSVLRRDGSGWQPAASLRGVVVEVAGIVTAFTVAHSLTLSLAVLGWLALPSRFVESVIAGTVVLAAIHNLVPVLGGRRWVIAFVLGLIHGFGFAGVLADLGLPGGALAAALFGFNLGVETGQLAIVAIFLPGAYLLRGSWFYRTVVFRLGSAAAALIAAVWLLERSLGFRLMAL